VIDVNVSPALNRIHELDEDYLQYKGRPIPIQEFSISMLDPSLHGSKFDYTKYTIPSFSRIAAAMLAVGGSTCEYSLEYSHISEYDDEGKKLVEQASSFLTQMLRKEIQVILSREPEQKGWRRLEENEKGLVGIE
jgi:hypothetical protein